MFLGFVHPGQQFAYERVETRIHDLISCGALRPGDRVPSVRAICRTDRVSKATAVQALSNLEAKSLISARPRSGFFVEAAFDLPLPSIEQPAKSPRLPSLSDDVAQVFREIHKPGIVAFGAGTPDPALLPVEAVARCVARAARNGTSGFGRYATEESEAGLRREIARRLAGEGCAVSPDEIVITGGCIEALNFALRAVASPGDTILVESPTYFGFLQMIESLGMKAIGVPATCDAGIDIDAFERSLKTHRVSACLLIPSFGNPHGACLAENAREEIAGIAAKRGIPIIEDGVYADLGFGERRPRALKSFGDSGNTILCGSLSKSLSPALRVGWAIAGRHAENVRRLKWISSISGPHVTALAAADYLRSEGFEKHLRGFRKTLHTQSLRISRAIAASFPQGTALSRPTGGYFLWVELPRNVDALALRDAALARGIGICPGPIFSLDGGFENFVRINCALPLDGSEEASIAILGSLARDLNVPAKRRL